MSKDTSVEMDALFYRMMMDKSCEERLRMGCSMFDASKKIIKSAILEKFPQISPEEMKRQIFSRFYGSEFSDSNREKILKVLTKN